MGIGARPGEAAGLVLCDQVEDLVEQWGGGGFPGRGRVARGGVIGYIVGGLAVVA